MLADDEARLGVLAALENRSRAQMPVGYPQLSRAGTVQQRQDAGALAFIGVLAGRQIGHPVEVGVAATGECPGRAAARWSRSG